MRADFHTHSFLSDGAMHPMELAHRAALAGYNAMAITDHIGLHDAGHLLPRLAKECKAAAKAFDIVVLPGVEITYVSPRKIAEAAKAARRAGAVIVIVHGETLAEPVPKGTNAAAVRAKGVDVLAHPGLLSPADAEAAFENGVFLEISAKRGHSLANGHVAQAGTRAGASFLVNSDTHAPEDLVTEARAALLAKAAGLSPAMVKKVSGQWPKELLQRHGVG